MATLPIIPRPGQPTIPRPGQPTIPQPTIPQPTIPQPTIPQATMPRPAIPRATIPQPTIPQATMPRPAIPQATMPRPAIPQATMARPAIPQATILRPPIPQATIPKPPPTIAIPQTITPAAQTPIPQPKLGKSGGITKQFTTGGTIPYALGQPPTVGIPAPIGAGGVAPRKRTREEIVMGMLLHYWPAGTHEQMEQISALTYQQTNEYIMGDNPSIKMEVINMLNKDGFDDTMEFLRTVSNPDDIVWGQPSMDIGRTALARELTIRQFEEVGVKGIGKCRYCGGTEIAYETKQLRGGDEPANIFARCLMCQRRWRES